jgi:hypothetical protein
MAPTTNPAPMIFISSFPLPGIKKVAKADPKKAKTECLLLHKTKHSN